MKDAQPKLVVKELAAALGVSVHFVYQMRVLGFKMEWEKVQRRRVSTEDEARAWLELTHFRLVHGRGRIGVEQHTLG